MNFDINTNRSGISLLPYMPFDPAWLEQSPAFYHDDPRLAIAATKLLFAAWRGYPAGTILSSHSYIASATGMTKDFVAEHYVLLTHGFELCESGRLQHILLAKLCEKMTKKYGAEIESFALAAALSMQNPEEFGVANVEMKTKRGPIGMTSLPKGFGYLMYPDLRSFVKDNNFIDQSDQEMIMDKFVDHVNASGKRQKDWCAYFRTYIRNAVDFGYTSKISTSNSNSNIGSGNNGQTKGNVFANLISRSSQSKGDIAAGRNMAKLEQAAAKAQSRMEQGSFL